MRLLIVAGALLLSEALVSVPEPFICLRDAAAKAHGLPPLDEAPSRGTTEIRLLFSSGPGPRSHLVRLFNTHDVISGEVIELEMLFGSGDSSKNEASAENGVFCEPFGIYFAYEANRLTNKEFNWREFSEQLQAQRIFDLPAGYHTGGGVYDGEALTIEYAQDGRYRLIHYSDPDLQESEDAKRAARVVDAVRQLLGVSLGLNDREHR